MLRAREPRLRQLRHAFVGAMQKLHGCHAKKVVDAGRKGGQIRRVAAAMGHGLTERTKTMGAILPSMISNSDLAIREELARLRAENAQLKAGQAPGRRPSLKVSEKGAISIYGMGRFPITLYLGQMEKLLAMADEIRQFIAANRDRLVTKD
jgi:hypothetical protein